MNVAHGDYYERVLFLAKWSKFMVNILKYKQYNKDTYTESIHATGITGILLNTIASSQKSMLG